MPSIAPLNSGAANCRFDNFRSRPSNVASLSSVLRRVLVEPIVMSSGDSRVRRPRDDKSTVIARVRNVIFAGSSRYSTASRGVLIRAIGSGAGSPVPPPDDFGRFVVPSARRTMLTAPFVTVTSSMATSPKNTRYDATATTSSAVKNG